MTNEQLFSNLNVVVDKRQQHPTSAAGDATITEDVEQQQTEALAIHHALSAQGFQVTPDLLAQYQETSAWIASHEIPVGNSASILRATAGRDLKRVLDLFVEATAAAAASAAMAASSAGKSSKSAGGGGGSSGKKSSHAPSSSSSPLPGTKPVNNYLIGKRPIIIVPKAMSAPITMANAHEFFAHAKFVPRDVMLKQQASSGGRRGAPPHTFSRRVSPKWLSGAKASSNAPIIPNNSSTGMLEFELMDNPTSKLGVDHVREWQRIVAVVSLGQSWQFKDWPGPYGQAVSLFGEHVYGCYIGLEGDAVPPDLTKWNVKKSKLSRDKRSLDTVTHANFWNELEEWMAIHKPELLPQTPSNH
jgi:parafibromin